MMPSRAAAQTRRKEDYNASSQREGDSGRENQKRAMVEKLTDAMVAVEGENLRPVTWVVIEEVQGGDWAIGGKPLAARDVKALAA
jgi:4-oxalocrotonate tautomerase